MEVIKKIIKQAVTTGTTDGIHTVIIPDLSVSYHLSVSLNAIAHDFGFFDPFLEGVIVEEEEEQGGGPQPLQRPTVTTGIVNIVEGKLFSTVEDNIIGSDGGSTILEYGVLHTSDVALGNSIGLVYENVPPVYKRTGGLVIPIVTPHTWSAKIIPTPNATVYVRAYALNAIGITYGGVNSAIIPAGTLPLKVLTTTTTTTTFGGSGGIRPKPVRPIIR